jgi:hypothetical protein
MNEESATYPKKKKLPHKLSEAYPSNKERQLYQPPYTSKVYNSHKQGATTLSTTIHTQIIHKQQTEHHHRFTSPANSAARMASMPS